MQEIKVYKDAPLITSTDHHVYENEYLKIYFQNGAVQEVNNINGTCHETLLEILIDRLNYFQNEHQGGKFKCRENALALTKIEEALMWLNKRTENRLKQNVEGRHLIHK